ncbi:hypothetical protein AWC38_SpisGene22359 [Stylophora pistillata]|uniref:DZIP3-like HEPN domain-containing protein n=1 Tax=Stylophora pistillata TaxID=50429 RepID=A0A2B4RAZ4_STYPI|nr:hypothetical protein AWC38_SpisGene22359 [Stylophora pistillata]
MGVGSDVLRKNIRKEASPRKPGHGPVKSSSSCCAPITEEESVKSSTMGNICGLVPPPTGWNTLPTAADMSLQADIVRIKCYRSTVYGHGSEASVDDATFNQYWQDIQSPLVRLGGAEYQSAIDDLKKECLDPDFEEHYKKLLRQWVKDEVSIKERLDQMSKGLDELKEAIVNSTKKAGDKGIAYEDKVFAEALKGKIAGLLFRG